MTKRDVIGACMVIGAVMLSAQGAGAALLGPTPYLSEADSPFAASIGESDFYLEDFEDGALNTPGVNASAGSPFGPGGITDSVDGDDGAIDGSGTAGWSFFSGAGSTGINFTFIESTLGALPTAAGIVWTDGTGLVTFQAFDRNGQILGTLQGTFADGSFSGGTAEDRFFGVTHAEGIARIYINNQFGGIEVDHLQYGQFDGVNGGGEPVIPEPTTLAGIVGGLLALAARRR